MGSAIEVKNLSLSYDFWKTNRMKKNLGIQKSQFPA